MISDLMILLGDGGFFRDNGLNSLPSIRHICSLLNEPDIFSNISYKTVKTSLFVRNSKFSSSRQYTNELLDANRPKKEIPSPIVGVRSFNTGGKHAVVLEDPKVMGYNFINGRPYTAKSNKNLSHDKIYTDEDGYEYIKLRNSWTELPSIEIYLKKGAWKKNAYDNEDDIFCLLEANSGRNDADVDTFAEDEESKSNCYYIDFIV